MGLAKVAQTFVAVKKANERAPITVEESVHFFIQAKKADGRAPRTVEDYHRVLDPFAKWCGEHGISVIDLSRDDFRRYVAELRDRGWAEATVAIHIRNLRCFLRWIQEEGTHRRI